MKIGDRCGLGWVLALCGVALGVRAAGETAISGSAEEAVPVEVFTPPSIVRPQYPEYPDSARHAGTDGWVRLNFMIDPTGKPYEITVVESTNKAFNEAAIESVKGTVYAPAMLNDKPIDASHSLKIGFYLQGGPTGAHPAFASKYQSLLKIIDAGDRAAADKALVSLNAITLHELAYKNLAEYQYYTKWGTEREQLRALRGAASDVLGSSPRTGTFLKRTQLVGVLNQIMVLEMKAQNFAGVLSAFKSLKVIDPEASTQWQGSIDEIDRLRTDSRAYRIEGVIDDETSWNYGLLKNNFLIGVDEGHITEIKLRCDKKYVGFAFESDLQYRINKTFGACWLEVIGDHGTRFHLTQS
jgi:TonB family protein